MIVDLRSDTLTRPTPSMMQAMTNAEVGDDVFEEDPSVNRLEKMTADLFGMEASLYCPTGTMSNQVAMKVHTQPGDEIICEETAHVYLYEGGGIAFNSGCQVKLLKGHFGRVTADMVRNSINPDDVHKTVSRLVCLENTSNRGGGACYDFQEILRIKGVCTEHGLSLHLDGARLFNALVATKETPQQYGKVFDSISVCLNKGLGCPMGSMLLGSKAFIRKARRVRKVFGGGMRQAGYMAACGIYALEHHIDRLREDHRNAKMVSEALADKSFVGEIMPVETNILIFQVAADANPGNIVRSLEDRGIRTIQISPTQIRMVFHLDITSDMVSHCIQVIRSL